MVRESFRVSPLPNRIVAVRWYLPASSVVGNLKRKGIRSCSPVRTEICLLARVGSDKPINHSHSHEMVSRELLMTMSCFSTLSPGWKLLSLLVKLPALPPM